MTSYTDDDYLDDLPLEESKSQRKRHMTSLQETGEQLLTLNERQLAQIELTDRLRTALEEYHRLPNRHEARRRQRQFIGKLMRDNDHEKIREALDRLLGTSPEHTRRSQQIEQWSERLLEGTEDDLQAFLESYPAAERQPLRTLIRRYQTLIAQSTPPPPAGDENEGLNPAAHSARRRLLDYLKSCIPL